MKRVVMWILSLQYRNYCCYTLRIIKMFVVVTDLMLLLLLPLSSNASRTQRFNIVSYVFLTIWEITNCHCELENRNFTIDRIGYDKGSEYYTIVPDDFWKKTIVLFRNGLRRETKFKFYKVTVMPKGSLQ